MKKQIIILASVAVIVGGFLLLTRNLSSSSGTLFETETRALERDEIGDEIGDEDRDEIDGITTEEMEQDLSGTVFVDVQGEVENPGVFEVERNVRVGYLIDLAGGLTDSANVRGLNRAARIYDEMVIFVPHVDDVAQGVIELASSTGEFANTDESGLISLSTASAFELQTLPGIGPTLSENIISHREANGAFSTVDELVNVTGIGTGIVENIRELVKP